MLRIMIGNINTMQEILDNVFKPVLGEELEGKAKFIKVDVDESPEIAERYKVMNIPAILVLKDGEQQEFSVGFVPKEKLKTVVEKYL